MGQEFRIGTRVWAWAPELEEAVDGPLPSDARGWYPAEVAAVDGEAGELFLNICTHDAGDSGEGAWSASMAVDLQDAAVWVRPRGGSPPPTHGPAVLPVFLGYVSLGPGEED